MLTIVGITDDSDTCECCGKRGLKRVVVLRDEDGEFLRYGTSCAAKSTRVRGATGTAIRNAAAGADAETVQEVHYTRQAAQVLADPDRIIRNLRAGQSYGDGVAQWTRWYGEHADALRARGYYC